MIIVEMQRLQDAKVRIVFLNMSWNFIFFIYINSLMCLCYCMCVYEDQSLCMHILDHQVHFLASILQRLLPLPYACSRTILVYFHSYKHFGLPGSKINFMYLRRPRIPDIQRIFGSHVWRHQVWRGWPPVSQKTKTIKQIVHQNFRYLLELIDLWH